MLPRPLDTQMMAQLDSQSIIIWMIGINSQTAPAAPHMRMIRMATIAFANVAALWLLPPTTMTRTAMKGDMDICKLAGR